MTTLTLILTLYKTLTTRNMNPREITGEGKLQGEALGEITGGKLPGKSPGESPGEFTCFVPYTARMTVRLTK